MHNIMKYVCDELEELDNKLKKGGKLSQGEIEYAKDMTELKKNILKAEMLEDKGYSNAEEHSYRRKRDSMGRYSSDGEYGDVYARDSYSRDHSNNSYVRDGYARNSYGNIEKHLEDLARQEPDMGKRRKIENFLDELGRM